jgi:trehalose 6-phosphate phosphatase
MELLKPGSRTAEPVKAAVSYQPLVASVLETVQQKLLRPLAGTGLATSDKDSWQQKIIFENKGVTASIHYRQCPDPEFARQEILQTVKDSLGSSGLKISEGRMVIELRPPVAVNKGTAMMDLAESHDLKSLIFLGDDLTDVDGFRALHLLEKDKTNIPTGFRGVAIGVHSPEMLAPVAENADYLVEGVAGVGDFLEWLARSVAPNPTPQ